MKKYNRYLTTLFLLFLLVFCFGSETYAQEDFEDGLGGEGGGGGGIIFTEDNFCTSPSCDSVGVFINNTATFNLKRPGFSDLIFNYGTPNNGLIPITGDFDGDGIVTIGLYDPATSIFYLKNSNSSGPADLVFLYGGPNRGFLPIVGDFNGDGIDTVGLYEVPTSIFYLRNSNTEGFADLTFRFPKQLAPFEEKYPIVGNWAVELQ